METKLQSKQQYPRFIQNKPCGIDKFDGGLQCTDFGCQFCFLILYRFTSLFLKSYIGCRFPKLILFLLSYKQNNRNHRSGNARVARGGSTRPDERSCQIL